MPFNKNNRFQYNIEAALSYLLGWLSGIIFFLIERDPFVRFHSMQSIITFGGLTIAGFLARLICRAGMLSASLWPVAAFGYLLNILIWPATVVLWVLLLYMSFRGVRYKLPLIGDLAERCSF